LKIFENPAEFSLMAEIDFVFNKTLILKNNVFIITGEMEFYNPLYFIGITTTHRK
jgi:hypothetical protein